MEKPTCTLCDASPGKSLKFNCLWLPPYYTYAVWVYSSIVRKNKPKYYMGANSSSAVFAKIKNVKAVLFP